MPRSQSNPSKARTTAALVLYLIAGVGAVIWKVDRGRLAESGLVPVWLSAVMPNFIPAAFLPMLLFITKKVVRPRDYLAMVLAILAALCAYEFAQRWMPKRTFDWADLTASAAGSCLGWLSGVLVFFRWLGSSTPDVERR